MTTIKKIVVPVMIVALVIALTPLAGIGAGNVYGAAKLAAPAKVTATSSSKAKVKITWSKVAGAKGYTVYKKVGSKFKAVKTTKGKSFTDKKLKKNKTYTYYVKAYKGKKKYGVASIKVTAQTKGSKKQNVKKLTLDKNAATLYTGEKLALKANLKPAKKLVSKKVTWKSSNAGVAKVDGKGTVTAVAAGSATITATAHDGVTAVCKVTVKTHTPNEIQARIMKENVAKLEKESDEPFAKEMTKTLAYDETLNDVDTWFRGGGSKAEHNTADYIEGVYKSIGLQEVTKTPVTVDGWETGESYLRTNDSAEVKVDVEDMVPYQATGSHNPDGTANAVKIRDLSQGESGMATVTLDGANWADMEIVNVGTGTAADYEGVDVKGKIVLAAVNQYTENWIDQPYTEAFYNGAAAIVTYQYPEGGMGYGMYNLTEDGGIECDTINVQDICAPDLIPCGSISPTDAANIIAAMGAGNTLSHVNFKLTCKVTPNTEAYVVTGKIPGKNHDQRILIGGHYDKYHGGVNDDCTAVALSTAIGKAMIDSDYKPQNDIYIVAHCAEEWGLSGAADDWAMGSWEMITEAHPEWQGSTLAFINFEMPAIKSGQKTGQIQTSYEFNTAIQQLLDEKVVSGSYYANGVEVVNDHNMGMSDCISYQENGVPCIINKPDFDEPSIDKAGDVTSGSWFMDRYHTKYDNEETYSSDLMKYDIALYGSIAQFIDINPALELDFTARCDELEAEAEGLEDFLPEDKTELAQHYRENLAVFRQAAKEQFDKAHKLNEAYAKAVADGKDTADLYKQGAELNKTNLQMFRALEDEEMGIINSDTYMALHTTAIASMGPLQAALADLKEGKVTTEPMEDCTLATIAGINGGMEFVAYSFSKFTYDELQASIDCDTEHIQDTWGYNKAVSTVDLYEATTAIFPQLEEENPDYSQTIAGYEAAYETFQNELVEVLLKEIDGFAKALMPLVTD
ncbi:MAG: M28 family peptidase [Firmicutes bacterium]|nr:M28 family peptidase [Bacillota bacterium]